VFCCIEATLSEIKLMPASRILAIGILVLQLVSPVLMNRTAGGHFYVR
jgi:hypothetical protein